jgi:hypothetical protein
VKKLNLSLYWLPNFSAAIGRIVIYSSLIFAGSILPLGCWAGLGFGGENVFLIRDRFLGALPFLGAVVLLGSVLVGVLPIATHRKLIALTCFALPTLIYAFRVLELYVFKI